jgi:hypothetical protein
MVLERKTLAVQFAGRPLVEALAEARQLYAEEGCFLARRLFSATDLEATQAAVSNLIDLTYQQLRRTRPHSTPPCFDDGMTELAEIDRSLVGRIFDACRRLLPVHRLSVDERLITIAAQLMGAQELAVAASDIKALRIDLPEEEKYLFGWHQDYPYVMDSPDGVIFWIPMQDVDETNGCLTVALGSEKAGVRKLVLDDPDNLQNNKQKMMRLADESAPDVHEQRRVPATLGDVLVFNTLLLHKSGSNLSDRARFTLQVRFGNFAHPTAIEKGWPGSMRDGSVFHKLHPEYIATR